MNKQFHIESCSIQDGKEVKMMKKSFVAIVIVLAAVLAMYVPNAGATAVLNLDDLAGNSVTISDADADGVITFNGALGVWNINVTTGLTKPAVGSSIFPDMDLNSVDHSLRGGNLKITFTDDGFTYGGPLSLAVGGTTAGTVSFDTQVNGTTVGTLGPFSGLAFSGVSFTSVSLAASDTLSLVANIHHDGAGTTSFDNEVSKVPEPGMLLLFGSGLVGLGLFRRRNA